jgi:hypothetical protein
MFDSQVHNFDAFVWATLTMWGRAYNVVGWNSTSGDTECVLLLVILLRYFFFFLFISAHSRDHIFAPLCLHLKAMVASRHPVSLLSVLLTFLILSCNDHIHTYL